MLKNLLVIALLAWGGWHLWSQRAAQAEVMVAPNDPQQTDLAPAVFDFYGYQITPLADFQVEARVLSTASYQAGREAELAPVDFALGWGRMSVGRVLDRLRINQHDRRYFYSWSDEPPLPPDEIVTHSANMHMIPFDAAVKQQLERVRAGDVVQFEGQLVAIQSADGSWHWRSSTRRDDTGDGACEVVLVKSIQVH